jgi:hypothetical protein
MKHLKRYLPIVLVLIFTLTMIAGCAGTKETKSTGTDSITKGDEVKSVEPTKFTMFFGNAGIAFPDDIKPDDNPFFEIFEKAANVDVEIIMPSYTEFQTKYKGNQTTRYRGLTLNRPCQHSLYKIFLYKGVYTKYRKSHKDNSSHL